MYTSTKQWGNLYTSSDGILRISFAINYNKIQYITIPIHVGTGPVAFVELESNTNFANFKIWTSNGNTIVTNNTWNCKYYSIGI